MNLDNIHDYHADTTHASKSSLALLLRSPFDYYLQKVLGRNPIPDPVPPHVRLQWAQEASKRHYVIGDALDRWLLENHKFNEDFYVGTTLNRSTREGKAQALQLMQDHPPHARPLTADEFRDVVNMAKAIHASPFGQLVKDRRSAQQTITWTDPGTGIPCKCRPDFEVDLDTSDPLNALRNTDQQIVQRLTVDVKTCGGKTESGKATGGLFDFPRDVANYHYDMQDSMYTDGLTQHDIEAGRDPVVREFAFLIVDTNWPHPVQLHILPPEAKAIGRQKYQGALATLKECRQSGIWPGLDGVGIQETQMPKWYLFQHRNPNPEAYQ